VYAVGFHGGIGIGRNGGTKTPLVHESGWMVSFRVYYVQRLWYKFGLVDKFFKLLPVLLAGFAADRIRVDCLYVRIVSQSPGKVHQGIQLV